MRRFTLCILAALAVLTAWAQATPPAGATIETWNVSYTFTYSDGSESDTEPMQVAFSGDDIYFNFPNPITGNTWMKGTRSGSTVTFQKGQVVGTYGGTTIYYTGLGEGNVLCDIVFLYDEAAASFTLGDMYLVLNGSTTQNTALGYFWPVSVTKDTQQPEPEPETVAPPQGLHTDAYTYTATRGYYDYNKDTQQWEPRQESISRTVSMGFSGNEVYVQGLCAELPQAWVKGTRDADGDLTLPSGQYYGSEKSEIGVTYHYYFAGLFPGDDQLAEAVEFSKSGDTYTAHHYIALNSNATTYSAYEMFYGARLTRQAADISTTPQEPVVVGQTLTDLQGRTLRTAPRRGLLLKTLQLSDGTRRTVKVAAGQ